MLTIIMQNTETRLDHILQGRMPTQNIIVPNNHSNKKQQEGLHPFSDPLMKRALLEHLQNIHSIIRGRIPAHHGAKNLMCQLMMINQKVQGLDIQTKVTTTMQTCRRVHGQVTKKANLNFIKKEKNQHVLEICRDFRKESPITAEIAVALALANIHIRESTTSNINEKSITKNRLRHQIHLTALVLKTMKRQRRQ